MAYHGRAIIQTGYRVLMCAKIRSTLYFYIRNPATWNWGANNRTGKAGSLFLGGGMRSARLTDNRIVLPRRTRAYTANGEFFTKLGPRLYFPLLLSLGPASRPGILAKTLCRLNPGTSEN
jgi:hypothetical protein